MSEYNIQMNKYNALNAEYDQLYPKPMKHANTHAKDGSDPILPSSIGAAELGADGKVLTSQLPSIEVDAYTKAQTLSDTTKTLFGLDATAVPDDVLALIKTLIDNANANADTKAKIQTGSYVGTGKAGPSTPNRLTFNFPPKFLFVCENTGLQPAGGFFYGGFFWMDGITKVRVYDNDGNVISRSGNTVSWYRSDGNATAQLNSTGSTYFYIAIG